MKVTQVALRPTEASNQAGRPSLTPELLAASGARYSRNNEGLEAILSKIDPNNLDKSVDSIFKMVDYGHQSIADMVPVSLFIDQISIWLAYYIWTLCPMAGGQESSTRYIKISREGLVNPEDIGIEAKLVPEWHHQMDDAFSAYQKALDFWDTLAKNVPSVVRIPEELFNDPSDKSKRQVARMHRNFSFDRSRYFLPVAATTNIMLVMSARNWAQLCQHLLSHPLPEPRRLGEAIRSELQLSAPRLIRHAEVKDSYVSGLQLEFSNLVKKSHCGISEYLQPRATKVECPPNAHLVIYPPAGVDEANLAADLEFHNNRYAYVGEGLHRTIVRFGWDAVSMAEIRDLNRHRTGTKYCPLVPVGFYHAVDQLPASSTSHEKQSELQRLGEIGRSFSEIAHLKLQALEPSYIYWTLLGTQYPFEHVTTADKFIYEAELRTGTGAHFRYAKHLRDLISDLEAIAPTLAEAIHLGESEPE